MGSLAQALIPDAAMLALSLDKPRRPRRLLCIGAHCDDIEIGCGGTILSLLEADPELAVDWVALSSGAEREREARASAAEFLGGDARHRVTIRQFRDGFFPAEFAAIKEFFEELKRTASPDLVLTHHRGDFHQDHRLLGELTWNTFRDHVVLEYEVPKFDGDLGRPNLYVPLSDAVRRRKVEMILRHFPTQGGKKWFTASTFEALMRLRGVECNAVDGYAEAFFAPKLTLSPG